MIHSSRLVLSVSLIGLHCYAACAQAPTPEGSIDLHVAYCTYIGGSQPEDGGAFLTLDGQGRTYVMLNTASNDCPTTPNAFDSSYNGGTRFNGYGGDIYAAKLSEDGGALDYGTYLGGTDHEFHSYFRAVDRAGHLYVLGMTRSEDFPTTAGAFDRTFNSTAGSDDPDVFLFKLDPTTGHPIWSTYIGGRHWEAASGIALGPEGSVYVLGFTNSPDFPTTPGCYDAAYSGDYEAFVCKFSASGQLDYSTFLGISDSFRFGQGAIVVDAEGWAWILKSTNLSTLTTTSDALDATYNGGDSDLYLTRLSADGNARPYGTYIGGNGSDSGQLRLTDQGLLAISGETTSSDFPLTQQAFDRTHDRNGRSFYAEFDAETAELVFSTFTPGPFAGWLGRNLILMQGTESADLPTTHRVMEVPFGPNQNIHLSVVDFSTGALLYGTYLGGSGRDGSIGLCSGPDGSIWIGGATDSPDLPTTPGALARQHSNAASQDGFVMRLAPASDDSPVHNQSKGRRYPGVGQALSDASTGDEITIDPGIYMEGIVIDKDITLQSRDPNDPYYIGGTIIQGSADEPVLILGGNSAACTIAGLTLRAGLIGVMGSATEATLRNCRIMDNLTHGVELCQASSPHLDHCLIAGNGQTGITMSLGTGRRPLPCTPTIEDCIIADNGEGSLDGGQPIMVESIID